MCDESSTFCKGITKSGEPCRARPMPGGLCHFHARPEQARILGQKGGRGNRYQLTEVVLPENVTGAAMLGTLVDQAIGEVLAGRMKPQIANAVAHLVKTRAGLTDTLELTARVANLERKLAAPRTATAAGASAAVEEPAVPVWWTRLENGDEGGGNGSGNNGKA